VSQISRVPLAGELPPVRIGVAALTRMSFLGMDLAPLWHSLLEKVALNQDRAASVMDLSVIAQLLGDQKSGLELQAGALATERFYRSPCVAAHPKLRVLALAAPTDIGGNTPLEFLLEGSDVELCTCYVVPGAPLPESMPAHDVAFVAAPASVSTRDSLAAISALVEGFRCPTLNKPANIMELDRDRLYLRLSDMPGLELPMTVRVSRADLQIIAQSESTLPNFLADGHFPLIVRPIDSHAGRGLSRLQNASDIDDYLNARSEDEFFLSRYVDYSGSDGLFRKYRIVFVDGRPYACHMAISDQWKIWYLNAEMAASPPKRSEEQHFMETFDECFAVRHAGAFAELARRIGLDYFAIDCAETKDGRLLLFEADNAMIVHDMDPVEIFPYKAPQMRCIFDAFVAMLFKKSAAALVLAA